MCKTNIIADAGGHIVGTHDWVRGFKPLDRAVITIRTEDEAQAHALWLEFHVSTEAGIEFLELFLQCGVVTVSEPGDCGGGAL
jgi:hypothetical protein